MAKTISGLDKSINSVWGASRTMTIGNKSKTVDGSENVSWTLEEIGAATSGQMATTNSNVTALNSIINTNSSNIGKISNLQTTNKNSLVDAINEVFQSGVNVKQQLVDTLIAKGIDCSTSDSWDTLISKLGKLGGDFTTVDEELLLLDKGTEYNTNITGGIYTAGGIVLTSGTGLVITPQSGKYKSFTFRNKINLSNYTSFEVTVQCPAGETEIGLVIDDTSVLGGTYSSYGNSTTTRPRSVGTASGYAGGTKTIVFDFAELYDMTGISFNRNLYIGLTFGYANSAYTITNMKFKNQRTYLNKLDIISATSLPATGEEGQYCIISNSPANNYVISSVDSDKPSSGYFIKTSDISLYPIVIASDSGTTKYYISAVKQGDLTLASYFYTNNTWNQVTISELILLENGTLKNDNISGGVNTSSGSSGSVTYASGNGLTFQMSAYYTMVTSFKNIINTSGFSTLEFTALQPSSYTTSTSQTIYVFISNTAYYGNYGQYISGNKPSERVGSTLLGSVVNTASGANENKKTYKIDISSITKNGYLNFEFTYDNLGQVLRILDIKLY